PTAHAPLLPPLDLNSESLMPFVQQSRYKRRNRIEIMFGRLKDWRHVATRYDRCPKVFLSAIALAALVVYWL
ncbi:transposase, partial [Tritonibacter sp. SIMBA_163]|uniref:transposase n=1 Tax=Tritonibacter sp. SIMBA_163 TaxID=3080868 RepID=UPI00398104EE